MLKNLSIRLIEWYQRNGGGSRYLVECNFEPSCSSYMKQSIESHGLIRGLKFGIKRLRRCNQPDLVEKIHDPVPEDISKCP